MRPFLIIKPENDDLEKQVNRLVNTRMSKRIISLVTFCFLFTLSFQAQDLPLGQGQRYTIGKIEVSGLVSYNEQTVIAYSGLKPGEELFLPGERVTRCSKNYGTPIFLAISTFTLPM